MTKMPEGGFPYLEGAVYPLYSCVQMSHNKGMKITTKVRRTHLGPRYDIYVDGVYSATAYGAREIEPIIKQLEKKYQ